MDFPVLLLLGCSWAVCLANDDVKYTTNPGVTTESTDDSPIAISAIKFPPFLMVSGDKNEGFFVDYLEEMCKLAPDMFCETEFVWNDENKFGERQTDGSYDGMIGNVIRKDGLYTQMSLGPFLHISDDDRERRVNFTDSLFEYSISVLVHSKTGIKSLAELVNNTDIKVGTIKDGRVLNALSHVLRNEYVQKLYGLLSSDSAVLIADSTEAGINKILNDENFAFVLETPQAEYYRGMHCELTMLGNVFTDGSYSFAVSPHKPEIYIHLNRCMAKLKKAGVVKKLSDKWFKYGVCTASSMFGSFSAVAFCFFTSLLMRY